jgi:hypothetical protein
MSEHDETCQRCGEAGEDRRTLWMAAMYDLSETGIPLQQVRVTGKYAEQTGEEMLTSIKIKVPVFTEEPGTQDHEHRFYTLRVCKDCRAEWMLALRSWYLERSNTDILSLEAQAKVAASRGEPFLETQEKLTITAEAQPGMIQMDGKVPMRVFGATISVPAKRQREPDCPLAGHSGDTLSCRECDQDAKAYADRIERWLDL